MNTESWKYTNIKKWIEGEYERVDFLLPSINYGQDPLPSSLIICSLHDALIKHSDLVKPYLTKIAPQERIGFSHLNDSLESDGLFIYIPKGVVLEQPLKIQDIAAQLNLPTLLAQRNLILLDEHSSATILRSYTANNAEGYWRNQVTEINLEANAQLNYYHYQNEAPSSLHTHYIAVQQARDSQFSSFTLDNGGGTVRTDIHTKLQGTQANCQLRGIYLAKDKQHIDNHTIIEHLSAHTVSDELYKGIINDYARAVFNGRILVAQHAQKVSSELHNENLLLSKQAEIDTKPELEIYADDVQCAHGTTVGQLDHDAIFYLMTRGITEDSAKQMLTHGFVHEMLATIANQDIKQLFNSQLEELLL